MTEKTPEEVRSDSTNDGDEHMWLAEHIYGWSAMKQWSPTEVMRMIAHGYRTRAETLAERDATIAQLEKNLLIAVRTMPRESEHLIDILETALAARAAEVASLEVELEAYRNPQYTLTAESVSIFPWEVDFAWFVRRGDANIMTDDGYDSPADALRAGQKFLDALLAPITPKGTPS